MIYVLSWWLIVQVLGWISLPLATRIFRWLPDRGYAFAKSFGLLLTSYLLWVGASTGLLRNDLGGILLAILLVAGFSTWIVSLKRDQDDTLADLRAFLREKRNLVLTVEILFSVAFVTWAILRAYAPYKIMETGGEKFMEIAFLNGILKSRQFPPLDPWLSGFAISYYYFGYVMMAMLTRLSGVPAGVGFELYDALLFALTASGAFGVVYNLVAASLRSGTKQRPAERGQPLTYGLLGALLVSVMGNLEGLLEALHARGILPDTFWQWIDIPGLAEAPVTGSWYPGHGGGWWWWRGSRILRDLDLLGQPISVPPITEFPFFSFLLGDNHPHVLALPFVLLCIAVALNLLLRQMSQPPHTEDVKDQKDSQQPVSSNAWWNPVAYALDNDWGLFLSSALILGSLGFLNTWDLPIYLGLATLAYGIGRSALQKRLERGTIGRALSLGMGLLITSVSFYAFFYLGFGSQAAGILPYLFPPTRLPQYLVMFGTFVFIATCFLSAHLVARARHNGDRAPYLMALRGWLWISLTCILVLGLVLLAVVMSDLGQQLAQGTLENPAIRSVLGNMDLGEAVEAVLTARLRDPWLFLLLSGLLAMVAANLGGVMRRNAESVSTTGQDRYRLAPGDLFAFLLIFVALGLTLCLEFFYLRDNFGVRMNTVFKFYYQGWIMLGCASAYAAWWLLNRSGNIWGKTARYTILAGMTLLISAGMVYPLMAFHSRVEGFQPEPDLDGASGVARNHPDDWAAIEWLQANAKGAQADEVPVILEAPGRSYNYEGRISAFTGYPAVLGWAVHESQWRGNYLEQGKREPDIAAIYTTHDGQTALDLLHKWEIRYVIVGATESNYIQQLCQEAVRGCNLTGALRKFDMLLRPVFQQGQVTIYQVP